MVIIELFIVYKGNARLHIYLIDNFTKDKTYYKFVNVSQQQKSCQRTIKMLATIFQVLAFQSRNHVFKRLKKQLFSSPFLLFIFCSFSRRAQ